MSRQITDILVLPYSYEQVQIGLNEFGTADNFNAAITKLDSNLQYLLSNSVLNGLSAAYTPALIPLSDILTQPTELHDAFVYNKAFYRTLYNNFAYAKNLWGQFYSDGTVQYILNTWLYSYQVSQNNYVALNEVLATSVINRCVGEIWKIQNELLRLQQVVLV